MNNPLIGKIITQVFLADDKKAIKFVFEGGEIIARADGDCCSHTWIEEIQSIEQLLNSPIVSIEEVDGLERKEIKDEKEGWIDEVIQHYGCKITTEKGYCLIDYRNSSNGYYGGNLSWPSDDYFYGGVHGQNVSNNEWKEKKMIEVIDAQKNLIDKQDELIACMKRQVEIRNEMIDSYKNIIDLLKQKIEILERR